MSSYTNERGVLNILVLLLLVGAVIGGVILVNQRTNWLPKAYDSTGVACKSGATNSIYLDSCGKENFRLVAYQCSNGQSGLVGNSADGTSKCSSTKDLQAMADAACPSSTTCAPVSSPTTPSQGSLSCDVSVADITGDPSLKKVSYGGMGGPVRVWLESRDLVSPIESIKVDGDPPIRAYTSNLDGYKDTLISYELTRCENNGTDGCVGIINKLELPKGKYTLHCDVLTEKNRCSGYTACIEEGGNFDCATKMNMTSCGATDHTEFGTGAFLLR